MYAHRAPDALDAERVAADGVSRADQRLQADITGQLLVYALAVVVQMVPVRLVDLPAGFAEDLRALPRPVAHFCWSPVRSQVLYLFTGVKAGKNTVPYPNV